MCLAVPMKLTEMFDDGTGVVQTGGAPLTVNLMLVPEVKLGDYVLVHAGSAIEAKGKLEAVDGEPRRLVIGSMALAGQGYVKPVQDL